MLAVDNKLLDDDYLVASSWKALEGANLRRVLDNLSSIREKLVALSEGDAANRLEEIITMLAGDEGEDDEATQAMKALIARHPFGAMPFGPGHSVGRKTRSPGLFPVDRRHPLFMG